MINENSYSKIHLYAELFIVFLLLIVIGLLGYEVFKPPLVNTKTIEELKKSAATIEEYTKELQMAASNTSKQIGEDNILIYNDKNLLNSSYEELLLKYGVLDDDETNENISPNDINDDNNNVNGVRETTESQ